MITIKEMAEKLNGCKYEDIAVRHTDSISELFNQAKTAGLVIVFCASDDLIEFEGAIYDEAGVFDGCDIYINKDGVNCGDFHDNDRCIKVKWVGSWWYSTNIPNEKFEIYDDGIEYCEGMVFSIDEL